MSEDTEVLKQELIEFKRRWREERELRKKLEKKVEELEFKLAFAEEEIIYLEDQFYGK